VVGGRASVDQQNCYRRLVIGAVDRVEFRLLARWVGNAPHGTVATVMGPTIPTIADLRNTVRRMTDRLTILNGWAWVAAASVIGFEGLEVVLGSMLAVPEFVPIAILALALVAVIRQWWMRRATPGLRTRRWLK
jgi:hypothetical protein